MKDVILNNLKKYKIILVSVFIFMILLIQCFKPSGSKMLEQEIKGCSSELELRELWKSSLEQRISFGSNKQAEIKEEFIVELEQLDLSKDQIIYWKNQLDIDNEVFNIIVVPDLSSRIIDSIQVKRDKEILGIIWEGFKARTKTHKNTDDLLYVDITNDILNSEDGVLFESIGDSLRFDLSENNEKQINRFYFDKVGDRFNRNIDRLYDLALSKKTKGANYLSYFENDLSLLGVIKEDNLRNSYKNILIILTDGYLELSKRDAFDVWAYTGTEEELIQYRNSANRYGSNVKMACDSIGIPSIKYTKNKYPNLEVLLLEVHNRPNRNGERDLDIIKYQWSEWFKKMEIKNSNQKVENYIFIRDNSINATKAQLKEFFNN